MPVCLDGAADHVGVLLDAAEDVVVGQLAHGPFVAKAQARGGVLGLDIALEVDDVVVVVVEVALRQVGGGSQTSQAVDRLGHTRTLTSTRGRLHHSWPSSA